MDYSLRRPTPGSTYPRIAHLWPLVVVFLTACAAATPAPTPTATALPAAPPTVTSTPTATPDPSPTPAALDLEPLLVQPGDLPAGFAAAQVRAQPPRMFDDLPAWGYAVYQQLARGDDAGGGITVISYDDPGQLDEAYDLVRSGMGDALEIGDLGERAALVMIGFGPGGGDLLFARCGLLVHIRMTGANRDGLTAYAERLDRRLTALLCP